MTLPGFHRFRVPSLLLVTLLGAACRREGPAGPSAARASDPTGSARPPPVSPTDDDLRLLGYFAGSLLAPANGTVENAVEFDGNSRIYGRVMLRGSSARYALIDANGAELPLLRHQVAPIGDSAMEAFEIDLPPIGALLVRLTGGPQGGQLGYSLTFANGRRLQVGLEPFSVAPGGRITITARLVDADGILLRGRDERFEGSVVQGGKTTSNLDFRDDGHHADEGAGDGIFGAFFDGTLVEGHADANVFGVVQFEGYRTARMQSSHFIVTPTGAAFAGEMRERGFDEDADGLFDELEFAQELSFTKRGDFMVIGDLVDARGEMITTLRGWNGDIPDGVDSQVVTLHVPGEDLVRHGEEGPWTVTDLRIVAEDAGSLVVAKAPDHRTALIPLSRFEPPEPPKISAMQADGDPSDPSAGCWATLHGSGLRETQSVLVDGREAKFQLRGDDVLGVFVQPTKRERPEGDHPSITVSVEVVTRWGRASDPEGYRYEW